MKKITWLLSILALLFLAGCSENPTVPTKEKGYGKIEIVSNSITAKKLAKQVGDSIQIDYDLGVFKASGKRFFGFKNVGTADIESLTVSCSESFCNSNPGFLTILQTDEKSSMSPILEIQILHGMSLTTGQMLYPVIPYGKNSFYIEFKGKVEGEDFYARFDFTLNSIYVNISEPASKNTQEDVKIGAEMIYENDTCSVYNHGIKLMPGDKPLYGFEYEFVEMINDERVERLILYPGKWKSDCVILNDLPEALR